MKKHGAIIVFMLSIIIVLPFLLYSLICIFPNMTWHGFGVDSKGRIYTGQSGKIILHMNQEPVAEIVIPKYRTYYFTVQTDDTILIADASNVNIYDISGNLLDRYPDPGPSKFNELQWLRTVHTPSGDTYKSRNIFGYHSIIKNNETTVYCTSSDDYLLSLLAILALVFLFATIIIMLVYTNVSRKNTRCFYQKR